MKKLLTAILLAFSLSGCGMVTAYGEVKRPVPYIGTMFDGCVLADTATHGSLWFFPFLIDGAFCAVTETVLLPITLPYAFLTENFYWNSRPSSSIDGIKPIGK